MVVDVAGEESLVIRQIPVSLRDSDVEQLLRDVLADLIEFGSSRPHRERTWTRFSPPWPATARCAPTAASPSRK